MIATRPHYTLDDYVRVEADSQLKHEFVAGQILAMAGGTVEHARVAANVVAALRNAFRGRDCMVLSSDARVGHETADFRAYPDASVVCGEPRYASRPAHTVTNPICVVEVLSESTAAYDRGEKLLRYQSMAALKAIVLVSQESRSVTVFTRTDEGFASVDFVDGESIALLDVTPIPVADLYD